MEGAAESCCAAKRGAVMSLLDRRVIVCCGAGGVGKTTVAASLGLCAARAGKRAVVITIDPSRRLAETLGIDRNPPEPVVIDRQRLEACGVRPPGELSAWMLDPKLVSDRVVKNRSADPAAAQALLGNRIYQSVSKMVAGMQEYTAVEALHSFIANDTYDMVILDTPPSRNALRFLESPARIRAMLNPRVFSLFLPREGGLLARKAGQLVNKVLDFALGEDARKELQEFLRLFQGIMMHLRGNQDQTQAYFRTAEVGFILVSSPAQAAVQEALFFEGKAKDLGLHLHGYVLNRSVAWSSEGTMPSAELLGPAGEGALERITEFAAAELDRAAQHQELAAELGQRGYPVWVLPRLLEEAAQLKTLVRLAEVLGD